MAQLTSSAWPASRGAPLLVTPCTHNSTRLILLSPAAATSIHNASGRLHPHHNVRSTTTAATASAGDVGGSPQQPWAPLVSFASYLASAAPMSLPPRLLVSLLQACASAHVQPETEHLASLCRNWLRQVEQQGPTLEAAESGIELLTTLAAMQPHQQQPEAPTGMAAEEHRVFMSSMLDHIVSAHHHRWFCDSAKVWTTTVPCALQC
jgi:hypothetical protein